ncbi:MAG: zinc ribbon domain-containing protein [Candidatus Limnocylindrales bacterium]|jgi:putative FmdB family regulatory protein
MPLYDYVCTSCGHEIEVKHTVHGHGPSACPRCGSPMKRVFSAFSSPAVHYKGTGWARKEQSSAKSSRSTPTEAGPVGGGETGSGTSAASSGTPVRTDED